MGNSMTCPTFTPPFGLVRLCRILYVMRTHRSSFPYSVFGPSPCPGHYSERLATMTSADFCPITPWIAPRHAMSLLDRCCLIRSYRPTASRYAQACFTSGLTGRFHKHAGHRPVGQTCLRRASLPRFHQRLIKRTFTLLNRVPCGKFNRVNFRYTIPPIWAGLIALHFGFLQTSPHDNAPAASSGSPTI